jgi:hypothetical protein
MNLTGKLVQVGSGPESGLCRAVVLLDREEVRRLKHLPMYQRVELVPVRNISAENQTAPDEYLQLDKLINRLVDAVYKCGAHRLAAGYHEGYQSIWNERVSAEKALLDFIDRVTSKEEP